MLTLDLAKPASEDVWIICERLQIAQSRQKSYADKRRRPLEFDVGESVFLRVSASKGITRFGKKGKLSPRYIGPFEILDRVGDGAYRLVEVHNVFHVSMLRKYYPDLTHVISYEPLELKEDILYVERPIRILDRKEKVL